MIRRVYLVVDVPEGRRTPRGDVDVELDEAILTAEERLEAGGGKVLFSATQDGYDGEFAELGADPSSWNAGVDADEPGRARDPR